MRKNSPWPPSPTSIFPFLSVRPTSQCLQVGESLRAPGIDGNAHSLPPRAAFTFVKAVEIPTQPRLSPIDLKGLHMRTAPGSALPSPPNHYNLCPPTFTHSMTLSLLLVLPPTPPQHAQPSHTTFTG